jgi:hypothetical protein
MINRKKLQQFIDEYKDKFIKDLDETCKNLLDTNDNNLIDLDEEYNIPKSDYVKSEPIIHLDVDKIILDIDNIKYKFLKNKKDLKICYKYITQYTQPNTREYGTPNFVHNYPINIKLNINEYIIKIYYFKVKGDADELVYITNYGRVISNIYGQYNFYKHEHTDYTNDYEKYKEQYGVRTFNHKPFYILFQNEIINCTYGGDCRGLNIKNLDNIQLIPQPELNYKIPKIFIDVIDAFYTQNTDHMQSCCKKYLETLNKTKSSDTIVEKEKVIEEQQHIIRQKDKEIERLKLELEERKKFYITQKIYNLIISYTLLFIIYYLY